MSKFLLLLITLLLHQAVAAKFLSSNEYCINTVTNSDLVRKILQERIYENVSNLTEDTAKNLEASLIEKGLDLDFSLNKIDRLLRFTPYRGNILDRSEIEVLLHIHKIKESIGDVIENGSVNNKYLLIAELFTDVSYMYSFNSGYKPLYQPVVAEQNLSFRFANHDNSIDDNYSTGMEYRCRTKVNVFGNTPRNREQSRFYGPFHSLVFKLRLNLYKLTPTVKLIGYEDKSIEVFLGDSLTERSHISREYLEKY
jgi:uncharacterized protein YukJ